MLEILKFEVKFKTEYPYSKEYNWIPVLHSTEISTQDELKAYI
jgi:hypothetical protein